MNIGPISLLFTLRRSIRVSSGPAAERPHPGAPARLAAAGGHGLNTATDPRPRGVPATAERRHPGLAVIFGVGPGFGFSLARCLATNGFDLVLVSRQADKLSPLVAELASHGVGVSAIGCDATNESDVLSAFAEASKSYGTPALVVYAVQESGPGQTTDVEAPAFESAWKHNCYGSFLVSREAARLMKKKAEGSILLIGSTSALIGKAGHLNLAVGKFGQRALSQVLARELWPTGIHVAHIVIDADIYEDGSEPPDRGGSAKPDITISGNSATTTRA